MPKNITAPPKTDIMLPSTSSVSPPSTFPPEWMVPTIEPNTSSRKSTEVSPGGGVNWLSPPGESACAVPPRIAARNRQSSSDFLIWRLSAVLAVEPRACKERHAHTSGHTGCRRGHKIDFRRTSTAARQKGPVRQLWGTPTRLVTHPKRDVGLVGLPS
ncbi:hypothetical protein D9M69_313450 [compost metagenome]